eukprot:TRINITY_DN3402_c0_g1_i2.p1 TRINITY_DN3402_c0_g1~~TRINITY_DN3402_c0_g1_i2.p1  ORF type:complete len:371 (-),score=108.29 TRINITY_DN3402_c0_g1_i2:322-1434(-)
MAQHICVLGGGISGLSTAHYLRKGLDPSRYRISLIEKQNRLGGWVDTDRDGFVFEKGPRSLRKSAVAQPMIRLIQDMNIEGQVIGADKEYVGKRFILLDKQLRQLPSSIMEFLTSNLTRPILPKIIKEIFTPRSSILKDDVTIHEFFTERLGEHATSTLIEPMVLGIYGGNARNLSLKSCFPSMFRTASQNRSFILGSIFGPKDASTKSPLDQYIPSVYSFQNGLATITDALESSLASKVNLIRGNGVQSLKFHENSTSTSSWKIQLENGETLDADYIFSALPLDVLPKILPKPIADPQLESKWSSMGVVNFGFSRQIIPKNLRGFGYLVPPKEQETILGVTFDSITFPQQNQRGTIFQEFQLDFKLNST